MTRYFYSFLTLLIALAITACASFPVRSFNDKLAVAYTTVSAIYDVTAVAVRAHKLTAPDAKNILAQADNVRDALDIARDLYTAKDAAANDKLATAIATLNALQTYLASHQ
jgi:Glucan phosphorylase